MSRFTVADSVISVVTDSDGYVVVCLENDAKAKEQEREHQHFIYELFRSEPFEEHAARCEANVILHISVCQCSSSSCDLACTQHFRLTVVDVI